MSFNIDYRPKTFDEVVGNTETIESLQAVLNQKSRPHVYLFSGPSGCGKTTLGRIVATELGCHEHDLIEINSSNNRGIDTARDIISQMHYRPLHGPIKVYLLDECFAKDTKVQTPQGSIAIEEIKIGDTVYNIQGKAKVKSIFKNKVSLNRVVRLNFNNGTYTICSKDHLFFTNEGWKKSIDLNKNNLILKFNNSTMYSNTILKDFKHDKAMPVLWERIPDKKQGIQVLFCFLSESFQKKIIKSKLRALWKRNRSSQEGQVHTTILFPALRRGMEYCKARIQRENENKGIQTIRFYGGTHSQEKGPGKIQKDIPGIFRKDEEIQSDGQSRNYRKGKSNKTNKWDIAYFFGTAWRKWTLYGTSAFIGHCSGLAIGVCNFFGKIKIRISDKLQGRHSKSRIEDSNRSRWKGTPDEKKYFERYKKNGSIEHIGLESIESYQPGNNDQSFQGIITDTEHTKGYVIFYDLEIEGHPSYFANNILVHNCHATTKDFQNALLKALEDTPGHVYFILCTTEPEKLIATIRNRATAFAVEKLGEKKIIRLLQGICKTEDKEIDREVLSEIAERSEGSPRQAVIMLQQIIGLDDSEAMKKAVISFKVEERTVQELCRALLDGKSWKVVSAIVKAIEDEPEKVRRAVLGYMGAVLLNSGQERAAMIIECFSDNYFNTGKAGLIFSCFQAVT